MNKSFLITCASLFCFSCSVGPDYKQPMAYTNDQIVENLQLQSNSSTIISREWYKLFNDPVLNYLINIGLENSPNIKVALEKMHQARYNLFIDRSGFLPTLDAEGEYDKSNQNLAGIFPIKSEYYQVGVDASWELDIWGGQRRLTESAQAMLKSAAANLDNVKVSLVAEIASQYVNWQLAQMQLEITEKNLSLQRDIFDTVKDQYDAGLTDELAFEQAKSVLHTTEMQIPQLKIKEKSYKNALATLIGKLPTGILKNKDNLVTKKYLFNEKQLYDLPVSIVRNRPDVQIVEQQLIAENALIGQAIANLFPTFSLSSFLGYQNKNLSPIFGPNYNMYTLGGTITLPILHWGELINKIKLQKSVTKQTLALYEASLLTAITDISNAIKSVEEEYKRNKSALSSMKAMSKILDLSREKYDNGLIDFSEVLTAEQNKLSAEQEYLQSNANIYLNIISFYKSVGGGLNFNHNNLACQKDETVKACVHDKD